MEDDDGFNLHQIDAKIWATVSQEYTKYIEWMNEWMNEWRKEGRKEGRKEWMNEWMKSREWEDNRRTLLQYILTCEQ